MEFQLAPITIEDAEVMIELFPDFKESALAVSFEKQEPDAFFEAVLAREESYPNVIVKNRSGYTMGFSLLHPNRSVPAISKAAEITCFVRPNYAGRGLKDPMLRFLIAKAEKMDFEYLVTGVSSRDEDGLRSLMKLGFIEHERTRFADDEGGRTFEKVWMQKKL
jgi:L-amino acid N-acyltransferase YncA